MEFRLLQDAIVFGLGCLTGLFAAPWLYYMIVKHFDRQDARKKGQNITTILLIIGLTWTGCSSTAVTRIETRERVDTLLIKGDTVRIRDIVSDTIYVDSLRIDTLKVFRSVRAVLDTTTDGVRLYAQFAYPPDRWSVNIWVKDTVVKWSVRDSIIERPYAIERVPVWVYLALSGMCLALVIILVKR